MSWQQKRGKMNPRLQRVRDGLSERALDAILITDLRNWRYLTGFTGDAGVLIVSQGQVLMVTDFRYYEQVGLQAPDCELVKAPKAVHTTLAEVVTQQGFQTLGFESQHVTVETLGKWKAAMPQISWVETANVVESLRQIKDADEIAKIEQAVHIADEAMAHIMGWIRPGMTEQEVAWELEVQMRTHGAEALSFPIIMASGPNGSMPHAGVTERTIAAGDPMVIDMGCVVGGYCSDLTRSFCVGEASEEYKKIWDTVLEAQLAVEAAIAPGVSGVDADEAARRVIYGAGYEGKFGHGTGHGVGLAIHEATRLSMTSTDTLREGMVVTVEPGIYIPGWGGVRIEDMVVVTEDGCRVLTRVAKQSVAP